MKSSIRLQITAAILAFSAATAVAVSWVVADRLQDRVLTLTHRAAADDAAMLAALLERGMEVVGVGFDGGVEMLRRERALYQISDDPSQARVQLIDVAGRVAFDTDPARATGAVVLDAPDVRAALLGRADSTVRLSSPGVVVASLPVRHDGAVVGVVRVHKPAGSMAEVVRAVVPELSVLALVLSVMGAAYGFWTGREITRPIQRLIAAARRIAGGHRQAALPRPRGREVRELTAAFEAMRSELEQRSAIEALAADLSHELKTPLASIRASSEVLADALEHDLAAAKRFCARIGESADHLEKLVIDLLALAHIEAAGPRFEEVDLRAVAERAADAVSAHAARRQVSIEVKGPRELARSADGEWLQRAIENLLVNAIAFSPREGTVELELARDATFDEIRIVDRGTGVDASIRDHLFERFRTTRREHGGTGLGLAIVRSIAEAHGGEALMRHTGPGGSTFAIVLPRG